jgi:pimeloyl-ACP methyl ester carboxylesterase
VYANQTDDLLSEVYKGTSQKELVNYFIREYQYPITTFPVNKIYNVILEKIEKQAYELNISGSLPKITIPTFLLWGKYDYVAPLGLKDNILENISSTDKSVEIFEHSGHTPMFQQPELFWQTVTGWIELH